MVILKAEHLPCFQNYYFDWASVKNAPITREMKTTNGSAMMMEISCSILRTSLLLLSCPVIFPGIFDFFGSVVNLRCFFFQVRFCEDCLRDVHDSAYRRISCHFVSFFARAISENARYLSISRIRTLDTFSLLWRFILFAPPFL